MTELRAAWRQQQSACFDLAANSTAKKTIDIDFWGRRLPVYANANLSIYSAQTCNARCPFCVEELRPASRGVGLFSRKRLELDVERYFARLEACLDVLSPLNPSVSITGGEPSLDPRLPRILQVLTARRARKITLTSNGSGLLRPMAGVRIVDRLQQAGLAHLNISRAHWDQQRNARLMAFDAAPNAAELAQMAEVLRGSATRLRLSCVLQRDSVDTPEAIETYVAFARDIGIDNVIFRQLMQTDPATHLGNSVVRYSDRRRIAMAPLLEQLTARNGWGFQHQVMGYYYYVEVWRYAGVDVVFEAADLAQLERVKQRDNETVHELVYHPSAELCSTWQPWDGALGPR